MRGKGPPVADVWKRSGITPAYAGKSKSGEMTVSHSGDHPRLCGEKFVKRFLLIKNIGSPPPMRGKVQNLSKRIRTNRITPAYAGKSLTACGQA